MMKELAQLQLLARQAGRGEREAADHLHRLIAPQMERLVRHSLGSGKGSSPFDRRVLDEARQMLSAPMPPRDRESLVRQVADRLCDNLLHRLPVDDAPTRQFADTLCVG